MPSVPPPKLHGLITIDSTNDSFTITGAITGIARAIALTAGDYFIRGHTAAGETTQLVERIQAQVRAAAGTEFDGFTASVSDTGLTTLANPSGENFTIAGAEWMPSSGGLGRILGYNANLTPAANSFISPNQHRYGWYPDMPPEDYSGDPDLAGVLLSDSVVSLSPSGRVTVTSYQETRRRTFFFRWLSAEYVYPTGTIVNRDFEQFWRDIIRVGRRWRYYLDRSVQTAPGSLAPWTYVGGPDIAKAGASQAEREVAAWAERYSLQIDAHEYVA